MHELFSQVWVVLAIIAGAGVLGMLHCVACSIRNEQEVRDLRVRIDELQIVKARLQAKSREQGA